MQQAEACLKVLSRAGGDESADCKPWESRPIYK